MVWQEFQATNRRIFTMKYPEVTITDVTNTSQAGEKGKGVNLGDAKLDETTNGIIARWRKRAKKIFHLKWEGNKIPEGAIIEGTEIAWTQNGQVTGVDGKMIGTYDRLVEFGGASGKEQQMLVFVL
jgi:hypothetical protein